MSVDVLEYDLLVNSLSKKNNADDPVSVARLVATLLLTASLTIAQLVLAQLTHSITLLVLVHQNIYNVLTLVVSWLTRVKDETSLQNTFGWRRLEVVGSIASLVFLFSLCFATMIEALQTLFHTTHLDTMHHPEWIMLLVGINLAVWLVSFFVIGGFSYHQSKAVRQDKASKLVADLADKSISSCSSFVKKARVADISRDLCGCIFTFLTCSLVYYQVVTEECSAYVDPIISIIYIVFLVWSCVPLVKESCLILLQTIPGNVEISVLKKFLLQKFPGILALHEVHCWTFTPGKLVLTGHIMYKNEQVFTEIHGQVEMFFSSQGFSQVTIQPEFPPPIPSQSEDDICVFSTCALKCKNDECMERTCCKDEMKMRQSLSSLTLI